jgi:O-antigen/teichoic acid export membrane protein
MSSTGGRLAGVRQLAGRVGLNTAWLAGARLGSQLASALLAILVARRLGQAGLGAFAFFSAVILTGNVLTTYGTDTLLIRELARSRDRRSPLLAAALWVQIGLSACFTAGVWLLGERLPNQSGETILALKIFSLALFPLAFYSVFSAALRAWERMELFTLANLAAAGAQIVCAGLALAWWNNLMALALALLAGQVLGAITAGLLCRYALGGFAQRGKAFQAAFQILRQGWRLALLGGFGFLSQRLAPILLGLLAGATLTGEFSAAARLVEAAKLGHYAYFGALLPFLANQAGSRPPSPTAGAQRRSADRQDLSLAILLALSALMALALGMLAKPLVGLLFGKGFTTSAGLVPLLAWLLVPYTVSAKLSIDFVVWHQEGRLLTGLAFGTLIAIPAYLLLTARLGLTGAGLAALASECVTALSLLALRQRPTPGIPNRNKAMEVPSHALAGFDEKP